MPKKDAPSKRLAKARARARAPKRDYFTELTEVFGFPKPSDGPFELPEATQRAFKAFGLNPEKIGDWATMVFQFSEAHFGKGTRGRRKGAKKWDDLRRLDLLVAYGLVKENHPKCSDEEICQKITKRFDRFSGENPKTLRRQFVAARADGRLLRILAPKKSLSE